MVDVGNAHFHRFIQHQIAQHIAAGRAESLIGFRRVDIGETDFVFRAVAVGNAHRVAVVHRRHPPFVTPPRLGLHRAPLRRFARRFGLRPLDLPRPGLRPMQPFLRLFHFGQAEHTQRGSQPEKQHFRLEHLFFPCRCKRRHFSAHTLRRD